MHTVLPKRVSTLFPSFADESFSATGNYTLGSYATASQTEKPVVRENNDGAPQRYLRPLPRPPIREQSTSTPSSSSPRSTSETPDPAPQRRAGAPHRPSDLEKEADITSALHGEEHERSRVVSDPASLMIFVPSTALAGR